jgi:isoleucyl-tRNA synthetase
LRRSRERFKSGDFEERQEVVSASRFVLLEFSKIIAPVMPFMAEHIYQGLKNTDDLESVHLCDWPSIISQSETKEGEPEVLFLMEEVRRVVSLAMEKRNKAAVKVRQPLRELKIKNLKLKDKKEYLALIKDEVNLKEVIFDGNLSEEVELDIEISEELKREGNTREFTRFVQELRKTMGLAPAEAAKLRVETDQTGKAFIEKALEQIKKPTNLKEVTFGANDGAAAKIDGMEFKIEIKRAP